MAEAINLENRLTRLEVTTEMTGQTVEKVVICVGDLEKAVIGLKTSMKILFALASCIGTIVGGIIVAVIAKGL